MELSQICDKITDDAKLKAQQIISEANIKAKDIVDNAVAKYTKRSEEYRVKSSYSAKDIQDRIISSATLGAQKKMLSKKREFIETAFQQALIQLDNLTLDEYKSLLKEKLKAIKGISEICVSTKYFNDITDEFVKEVNCDFSKSKTAVSRGFSIKQETCVINYDFSDLIKQLSLEYDTQVANILFS